MTTDRPDIGEMNGLVNGLDYHNSRNATRKVCWTTPGLRVTRLRLLSDPGYPAWDVSYCHGRIGNEDVDVELPFSDLPKSGYRRAIVQHAIRDGVHAQRMGLLENISTLN
jgi:hypothetical protein